MTILYYRLRDSPSERRWFTYGANRSLCLILEKIFSAGHAGHD